MFFFFKQKTAYEMRISDWSSDVCSSDLHAAVGKRFRYRYRRRSGSGAAECRHVVARVARRRRNRRPRESRFRATCGREKEMRYRFPTLLAALLTLVGVGTVAGCGRAPAAPPLVLAAASLPESLTAAAALGRAHILTPVT